MLGIRSSNPKISSQVIVNDKIKKLNTSISEWTTLGSSGCIVPEEYGDFTRLLNQVKNTECGTLILKKSKGEVISCGNSLIDNL